MLRQLISRATGAARRQGAGTRGTGTMAGGQGAGRAGLERGAASGAGKVARGLLRKRR